MKKKIIALLTCASLLLAALSGCKAQPADPYALPEEPVKSTIRVEPVENISDDFIRGMDASAVLVCENSGVTYYGWDGQEQDVFRTLAQAGVNYIRLRVWNDPYDENGNGYGGGNNDVATAIELGKRATQYGMQVCIDFHYSDFWADPKRQHPPKAWEGMDIDQKSEALYQFTIDSLTAILDAGVDVGMVQIGNEINNGMSGETRVSNVMSLLNSGSRAVREISAAYEKDISIAVHYTSIENNAQIDRAVSNLSLYKVDYDIFALSFYPFWDGSFENMQNVARGIQEDSGKQVIIAETSYCYTAEDGDGCGNSLLGTTDLVEGYPATVQGQASMIRDICAAANEAGVTGVFYWEGTWLPVGKATADNSPIWEQYGSGWASSYAADYDPDDAGLYYGGCSWDNQAMFDFDGYPLESLNVFRYLEHGTITDTTIDNITDSHVTITVGQPLELPAEVEVIYNDSTLNCTAPVEWAEAQLAAIDTSAPGQYTVTGTVDGGAQAVCTVEILPVNYVLNPSFEDSERAMWKVTHEGIDPTDFQKKADDAYTGEYAFHFWSTQDMDFCLEQQLTGLEPGVYTLSAFAQGGDISDGAEMELYAITESGELATPFQLTTYADWKNPTVTGIEVTDGTLTIGVRIRCGGNGWGTVDDFVLSREG